MAADALTSAFGNVISALFLLAGIYVYVSLIRQIKARPLISPEEQPKPFGLPELFVAFALVALLLLSVMPSSSEDSTLVLNTRILLANLILVVLFVVILAAFLTFRGFNIEKLAGFSKLGVFRAVGTGAILLFFSWPLISVMSAVTQQLLRNENSLQSIVELFNGSQSIRQRILVIVLAVAIAPIAEEFVFRFFIYGVLKRYCGFFLGLVLNALLFATVHAHLPSFAPLVVLGGCLTLAYEWSGSILVSMSMHMLFNSLQLIVLAFPSVSAQ